MAGESASEADLISRAREGSDAAFARLVDRHQRDVRRFLARVCPVASEVDDIAQETFLAAWTSLRLLRASTSFRGWLLGIAWRKAQGAARSAARTRARDTAWSDTQPTEHLANAGKALALEQAMAQLTPDQRASVALCLGAGLSHSEAASAMKIPLGTLKSHVLRGRARLQEILGAGGTNND